MPLDPNSLLQRLARSKIYQDYEKAFQEATKLPLALRTREVWNMVQHRRPNENPFCRLMAKSSRSCAACLEVQEQLAASGAGTRTVTCFAGLCDSAVPVRLGDSILGYLQTGQVAIEEPTRKRFSPIAERLITWGLHVDLLDLEEAWLQSHVLRETEYMAMVKLLETFGLHLSLIANQLAVQTVHREPGNIKRARQFILSHSAEPITLDQVAKAVNTSTYYFCRMFKKATGLHFTDYLSRIRVEKAKELLSDPNRRVSEVAFESGFQSLTHFNREFLRITGKSPSSFRQNLPALI